MARKPSAPKPVGGKKPTGGQFVGLDIGSQTIKVVEVKGAGNALTVTGIGIGNTPPGTVQAGQILDPKALGAAVKALLTSSGIRGTRSVSAATGANSVVVRVIEVPKMTPAELAETMKWEIERHIPFPASEVEMGYQPIDDDPNADPNNPNMEVLLAVAQREMIAQHMQVLQSAKLTPTAIDVEPLAAGRALIDLDRTGLAMKNVVVVNIGASNTDVGVFKQAVLRFPRTIPIAGDNFTRAIADHLGLTMDQAEDEKRENAVILMDLVQANAAGGDPFGGGGGFGDAPQGGASPFDFSEVPSPFAQAIPPANPFDAPAANPFADATPAPAANPFGDNPFATTAAPNPFDTGTTPPAAGGAQPPAPEDPRSRRRREVFDALMPVLEEFSMELRRSVDYFRSRYPSENIDAILVCGGSAMIQNIDQFIQSDLGIPTMIANPFAGLNVQAKNLSPDFLHQIAPSFAVAVGLAARDAVIGPDK